MNCCCNDPIPWPEIPQIGDTISWCGTQYTVIGIRREDNTVQVRLGNNEIINLWWRFPGACKIISRAIDKKIEKTYS